jgi:hypothetical protein
MFKSYTAEAAAGGREAAQNAASWIGPVEVNSARALLGMLSDGDPAVWDYLPAEPNLSGEWSDDATPITLAREITGDDEPDANVIDVLADAFESAVSEAFESACEREIERWA